MAYNPANWIPMDRVKMAVALLMQEALVRGHEENGPGYTPSCRLLTILMDLNEEVNRGINERMSEILQGELNRAKNKQRRVAILTDK